ncbi:heat shock protein HtpX, M48 family peptidase [Campylobacter iguaniorum]|uniref:Protease HtpX homolog n=1 Tax=Campylobacter iguaniorum TaxID=1244531 RepID=A0A076FAW4_9BACT|nr:zinc metalloprotease HtpX [Campylobacter iguaniorum]AII15355.1 heat shock protein HtpX, M48 family peptidase [Campylobacter iguaniorum]ALV25285.1 heat shock protein HtpX, M48 family peptidase [Campylobacter iguaniorum]
MEIFKTAFLMVALMLLFITVGFYIGGSGGILIAFCVALAMNFFSYFFSDKLVLKHYNAQPVLESSELYNIVRSLVAKANLPMPKLYIIADETPNAFATGRNPANAAVAVTSGLLNLMSENEIKAVIAHELGHVNHYDILTGSIAAVFAGSIAMLANFAQLGAITNQNNNRPNIAVTLILAIIMPLVATIIQMSISRSREYEADRYSAFLSDPKWLISALSKLENYSKNGVRNADPQTAHMFIINPFGLRASSMANLFRTHPTTEQRIAKLESYVKSSPASRYFNS